MDTQKLTKLMNLTMSDNDHEALLALRKANEMLREKKVLWDSVIMKRGVERSKSLKETESSDVIVRMLKALLASTKLKGTQRQFVESLEEYYDTNGYLSERQEEILRQIYERKL